MDLIPQCLHVVLCRKVSIDQRSGFPCYMAVINEMPWSIVSENIGKPVPLSFAFAVHNLSTGSHKFWLVSLSPLGEVIQTTKPIELVVKEASNTHCGHIDFEFTPIEPGDFVFRFLIDGNPIATCMFTISTSE